MKPYVKAMRFVYKKYCAETPVQKRNVKDFLAWLRQKKDIGSPQSNV